MYSTILKKVKNKKRKYFFLKLTVQTTQIEF
jgi:hypothetical protein